MREIKYRAWLKDLEIMQTVSELNMWNLGHVFTVDEDNFHYKTSGNVNYILMQYTRLKDKNGVEIYEGDILKITCDFKAGRKEIVFDKVELTQCSWACSDWFFFELIDNQLSGQQLFEVIGNIYENPELLEESTE